jgi:protein-disulfide isomerase
MASKDQSGRVSAARQAAIEARARQRAVTRRRTALAVFAAVGLAAVFVVAVVLIVKSGGGDDYEVYDSGVLTVPQAADETGGILIGPGGAAGGTVADGAIRIDIYEDFRCPGCLQMNQAITTELDALRDSGAVEIRLHVIAFLDRISSDHYSTRAASAAATIAEYDAAHYEAFVDALYAVQPPEEGNPPGLTNAEIADVARGAGVSEEAIAKIADGEFTQWVAAATNRASVDGVNSTPTLLVGGVEELFYIFPGILTFDTFVVAQAGPEGLTAVNNERLATYGNGSDEELAALQQLLTDQVTAIGLGGTTPEPSPAPSS